MRKLAFVLLLASIFATAQPTPTSGRAMTFNDMMAMKRLGSTAVSPDGRWLAYSVSTVNLQKNSITAQLYLQPIAGGDPVPLTFTQPGDSGVQFSSDGHHILFLSARTGSQQAWIADFDSAIGQLTHPRKVTNLDTGVDNAVWSPDSQTIAFTSFVYPDCPPLTPGDNGVPARCNYDKDEARADDPVKAQIFTHLLFRHWNHFTGPKRSHLFLVSVATGAVRDLTPHQANDVPPFSLEGLGCGCAFSPDSKEIAYTLKDVPVPAISTNADIFTLDISHALTAAPLPAPVKVSTSPGGDFSPAYSPDGKYLAWRSQARPGYESDKFRLVLMDRKTRQITYPLADFHFDRWVDEFSWVDDSQHILFVSGDRGEAPVYEVNVTGDDLSRMGRAVGDWSDVHLLLSTRGMPVILGTLTRVDRPAEVVLGDALEMGDDVRKFGIGPDGTAIPEPRSSAYEPKLITHLNTALLAQLALAPMEPFWFTAKDGTKLEGFIIRPPHFDPAKKYPVKFLIHGGPQGAWDQSW
ncbi:MAG TPA: S9 family peptidase, partial [Terracidiphilus sp.]|nr:S9 family peptidase [Terracidiphilus sp.]